MSQKSLSDQAADVLDIHIVDIAAQLEALLRSVRELQRRVLVIRGALPRTDADPGAEIQARLGQMLREAEALSDAVNAAADAALTSPGLTSEEPSSPA